MKTIYCSWTRRYQEWINLVKRLGSAWSQGKNTEMVTPKYCLLPHIIEKLKTNENDIVLRYGNHRQTVKVQRSIN